VELALPVTSSAVPRDERLALTVRVGRGGMIDHAFRSTDLEPFGGM
jgi:hypothetical protein